MSGAAGFLTDCRLQQEGTPCSDVFCSGRGLLGVSGAMKDVQKAMPSNQGTVHGVIASDGARGNLYSDHQNATAGSGTN